MISICIVDTKQIGIIPQILLNHLTPEEKERANKIRSPQDRRQFLIGRIMLRKALSDAIGGEARDWNFITGESGKMRLADLHGLPFVDFNISHSNGVTAIAISKNGQVGVDLELITPFSISGSAEESLLNVFNQEEQEFLNQIPASKHWREILRLWSVKEAYAKLLGLGAQIDFDMIDTFSTLSGIKIETQEIQVDEKSYYLSIAKRGSIRVNFTSGLRMANPFQSVSIYK
jgi:phosphopantetheinyl transferase